jgi:hypothetical protein
VKVLDLNETGRGGGEMISDDEVTDVVSLSEVTGSKPDKASWPDVV